MITLIGTGHVFDLSSALIENLDEKKPDVICVELDKQRYNTLIMKHTSPESYKNAKKNVHIIYKLLARFQDSMAKEYGVSAGDEMLTAIKYAQSHQIPLEFIDMNAQNLFTKMLRSMSMSEKLRLLLSGFGGMFVSKKRVENELKKIEGEFDTYIEQIGSKFPTIKRTLIDERNLHMAKKLIQLMENHENIVACIGDGHIPGISKLLSSDNVEYNTIRLSKLREKKTDEFDTASAHFTTNYKAP
jgi:pheromone shutdown protein TraB